MTDAFDGVAAEVTQPLGANGADRVTEERFSVTAGSALPRYRSTVRICFPALHSIRGLESAPDIGRPHGHDFTAEFVFEAATLVYPGIVVGTNTREEIERHVRERLAYRDLDQLLDRPPTCEAIAEHLVGWFLRSVRGPDHASLVSVAVSTSSGAHGEVLLVEAGRKAT